MPKVFKIVEYVSFGSLFLKIIAWKHKKYKEIGFLKMYDFKDYNRNFKGQIASLPNV